MIKHRRDIDGLRSLAVVPVILFHLAIGQVAQGGFVGVDIFFVISGFLITKIIYDGVFSNTYSVTSFYVRRARRIIPALISVYLFCLITSAVLMFESEQIAISKAIIYSVFFSSNIYFYLNSGYFSDIAKSSPLLHTWSLSVEEQFYIFLPIFIWLCSGFSKKYVIISFYSVFIVSLLASMLLLDKYQDAVFYLLPFRAWELLTGSLLAIGAIPPLRSRLSAEILSIFGLALILASITFLDSSSPFPGLLALPSCVGAGLVIHAGSSHQETMVGRMLSFPIFTGIGLISYSMYLWHWPLIVLYPIVFGILKTKAKLLLFAVTIIFGWLSWRFIEQPFRKPVSTTDRPFKVIIATVGSLIAIACASILIAPVSARFRPSSPQSEAMLAQKVAPDADWRLGQCFLTSASKGFYEFDKAACLQNSAAKPSIMLIGDSHAAQYYPGLKAAFFQSSILQATASGCRPVGNFEGAARCHEMMEFILKDFLPRHRLNEIILSARWQDGDEEKIGETVRQMLPFANRVIVFGPIVEYDQPLPRVLALASPQFANSFISKYRVSGIDQLDAKMAKAVASSGATYVSIYRALCPGECFTLLHGRVVQFDYGHLSTVGSRFVVNRIRAHIKPQGNPLS